ncbi:MAG: hypothetical protein J0H11_19970 [Rhizobiales bacterium]|nr:hypothetical protein [Hyphomicrobiales bacterium]
MFHRLMALPPIWVGLGYVVLAFVLLALACAAPSDRRRLQSYRGLLWVSVAALFVCRLPMFFYDRALNPDEALMAANALRARYGWLNWNIVDPLTAGPVDSMVLIWPRLLGLDITFFSVRLTGAVLLVASFIFLAEAIRRQFDARIAMVAVIPAFIFSVFTHYFDFVHYTSEILSILMISFGIFCLSRFRDRRRSWFLVLAAFASGVVPFAKLQGAPIAAVVGLTAFGVAFSTPATSLAARLRRSGAVLVAGLLPAAIFLVPLALGGGFDDFIKSYFEQQRLRIAGSHWSDKVPGMLSSTSFGALALSYGAALALGIVGAIAILVWRRDGLSPKSIGWGAAAVVFVGVSYAAVAVPGREFTHYLLLGLPSLVLVGAGGAALATNGGALRALNSAIVLMGMTLVMLAILVPRMWEDRAAAQMWSNNWMAGIYLKGKPFATPRSLQWLRPEHGDSLLCWGWQAECYVDSALPPATREATNENQLYDIELRDYFRARFIDDLLRNKPSYIVDTVAPGSFVFEDAEQTGIKTFPELQAIVDADYRLVSKVADKDSCPRVYAERSRAEQLDRSRIAFSSIVAAGSRPGTTPDSVDDGSIFDRCVDYWLAPDGTGGSIELQFREASPVKRILLLNTRNGIYGDRGSRVARVSLLSGGKEVWSRTVNVEWFPHWTSIELDEPVPQADALRVEILQFWVYGGGLSEVKAYRD